MKKIEKNAGMNPKEEAKLFETKRWLWESRPKVFHAHSPYIPIDELTAVAMTAFLYAIRNYDKSKGSLNTYAHRTVDCHLMKYRRDWFKANKNTFQLPENFDCPAPPPHQSIEPYLNPRMTEREKLAVRERAKGKTLEAIGKELGVKRQRVNQILQKAIIKIKRGL